MENSNNNQKIFIEAELEEIGKRLDVIISSIIPEISRNRVQQLIELSGSVSVNGQSKKPAYRIKQGDEIELIFPSAKPLEFPAENIPLEIVYEDENMLVVNKPSGMLTHPTSLEREKTLVNALLWHCKGKLSGINGIMRPGIVHRLDRDTSGLLMIAKNDFAHASLTEQIRTRSAKRHYLAVVKGAIQEEEGILDFPIGRNPKHKHKMAVVEDGKPSQTRWKVFERFKTHTLIEATLETGRTHQIRVHFSHINHAVAGDGLYGNDNLKIRLNGQALQAYKLCFTPPGSFDVKILEIEPENDIKKLIRYLRQNI